ncbi:pseudouridine synthase [Inmirania thermothiophila]|uniref:tRNA pseudouridine synthase C n=1 Tax=Inmirania thermothiophila TaxID=1750597 RepID=A0A3N1Y6R0_9GAMM|nr:pseudouridine synthase [Inmirania thermothiophila]ROR34493.1 tRNA pseudouridine synthase C [Inmirania thermothiophila]
MRAVDGLEILYRDDCLVAVHKPAGLAVHRSRLHRRDRRHALQLVRERLGRRVWPVHRLDRATSGLLLFALDPATARHLGAEFAAGRVAKRYLAVVRGHPPEAGVIDRPLRDHAHPGAPLRDAVTAFRRLATVEIPEPVDRYPVAWYALLEVRPRTGRHHQIRRHLKHAGHPIIGDTTHGQGSHNRFFRARFGCGRLLLAAVGLRLAHPAGGTLELTAPLAEDFAAVLDALGWGAHRPRVAVLREPGGASAPDRPA